MKCLTWVLILFSLRAAALDSEPPVRVAVKGLVCAFCAQGLDKVLRQQAGIDRFEIRIPTGEVLLWPKADQARPSARKIREWIEMSGLGVKGVSP